MQLRARKTTEFKPNDCTEVTFSIWSEKHQGIKDVNIFGLTAEEIDGLILFLEGLKAIQ